jgi:glycosyltransferase involved in cell wall biosynthesis
MPSLYAFDEDKNPIVVHQKSRVIKNDNCVEWAGALHEDFKENRDITIKFIKDIEIIHLTDNNRCDENAKRNLAIAQKQMEQSPDDPRSYWNVANSLKQLGENMKALDVFEVFISMSQSDEEKYLARLRMAEAYWSLTNREKALDSVRYAIGLKPHYPDAYHLMGSILMEMNRTEEAVVYYKQGLTKKPPYYSIIVYNPRDYDYVPLMNLARAYFTLMLPKLAVICLNACAKIYPDDKEIKRLIRLTNTEQKKFDEVVKLIKRLEKIKDDKKLKKEFDKIPEKYKAHPAVCNLRNTRFIKKESSGKDLVIYCSYTAEEWTPKTVQAKGIGGSEEAVIHLSQRLADKGWNVVVYNNCGYKEQKFGNVVYRPYWTWNYRDKQDAVILWRHPKPIDFEINCDKIYVDLHDVIPPDEFTDKRLKKITKIFVKSNFHRSLYPNIDDNKFAIIPNGIESEKFNKEYEKDKYLMINTSSPDRGLKVLLELFGEVKKQVPEVKLKWAYGWNVFDAVHGSNPKIMKWKDEVMELFKQDGVENLNRINHEEVAKLYQEAAIYAYPSEFAEIDCISLTKAMAAGCIPITTNFAAMGDKSGHGGFFINSNKKSDNWSKPYQFDFSIEDEAQKKEWVKTTVKILKERPKNLRAMREWAQENFDWEIISNKWNKELCGF